MRATAACSSPPEDPEPMRRSVLQSLLALALAALFAAPVAAVQPGGADLVTLRGTLQPMYVETFRESHPAQSFALRTRTGDVPLAFTEDSPVGIDGAEVELSGRRIGHTFHVASARRDVKVRRRALQAEYQGVATLASTGPVSDPSLQVGALTATTPVAKNVAVILI